MRKMLTEGRWRDPAVEQTLWDAAPCESLLPAATWSVTFVAYSPMILARSALPWSQRSTSTIAWATAVFGMAGLLRDVGRALTPSERRKVAAWRAGS